uniref:SKP1 component POZ domain-containing protein n=1 Tax=Oryza glumipatula TaxID=40148 RepID=A0A0E0AFN1_9ORYZ
MAAPTAKTVILISADGKHFEVTEAVASQSQLLSNMIEDDCTDNGVRLPNVDSDILVGISQGSNFTRDYLVTNTVFSFLYCNTRTRIWNGHTRTEAFHQQMPFPFSVVHTLIN